jgi:inosose dehydratase
LSAALAVTGATLVTETVSAQQSVLNRRRQRSTQRDKRLHVAINQFTCHNIYSRDNIDFWTRLDELKSVGVDGIEVTIGSADDAENLGKQLTDNGLAMRSVYTGLNLHEAASVEQEIDRMLKLGEKAKTFGTEIIVFNPAAKDGKSDAELILQSQSLDILGAGLKKMGISLAFHYHTTEFGFGGREFHHILCGTDPKNVAICFEQHWSYRACGNSQVAMFDHLKLYGDRSVEVHLRQSINNVWSETFGDGDIDNVRLATGLKKQPKMPHVVLEQAAEGETPKTMAPIDVFRQSVEYIRRVFG